MGLRKGPPQVRDEALASREHLMKPGAWPTLADTQGFFAEICHAKSVDRRLRLDDNAAAFEGFTLPADDLEEQLTLHHLGMRRQ